MAEVKIDYSPQSIKFPLDDALTLLRKTVTDKYGNEPWVVTAVQSQSFEQLKQEVGSSTFGIPEFPNQPGRFDYEAFYEHLRSALTPTEVSLKIIADYGQTAAKGMYEQVGQELGPEYIPLLVEPALATKVDAFISFVKGQLSRLPPEEARKKFIEESPWTTTYRMIALAPDSDLTTITHEAGILRNKDRYDANVMGTLFRGINYNIRAHVQSITSTSPYISVTDYPEMTLTASQGKRETQPSKTQLALLKIHCNSFYLISFGDLLKNPTVNKATGIPIVNSKWQIGERIIPGSDPGVERFFELCMPSDAKIELLPEIPTQEAIPID